MNTGCIYRLQEVTSVPLPLRVALPMCWEGTAVPCQRKTSMHSGSSENGEMSPSKPVEGPAAYPAQHEHDL